MGENSAFLILQLIRDTLVNEVVCLKVEILFWGWGEARREEKVLCSGASAHTGMRNTRLGSN